jgi:ferrous iron transport protein B
MTDDVVLLVGNPNVGKSTLFASLTGARQPVMNAPGTTVEVCEGTWHGNLLDTPGTYGLVARTPGERVAVDAIAANPHAVAVVLLDASALARSLYLLAQVGRDRPVVAALVMTDVAHARGVHIDAVRLGRLLDVPVVPIDPRTGDPDGNLAAAVDAARPLHDVPDHCEDPLESAEALFEWVEPIVAQLELAEPVRDTRSDAVDRVLLNPRFGIPIFLASIWLLFELTTKAAGPLMSLIGQGVSAVADAARGWLGPAWLEGLLVDGVLVGVGTVATLLPVLAVVYLALAILEDSGYLARAAFLADRWMRTLGLDGRAMLPLVIGFGCNVPAVAATATLPSKRQRVVTGLLVPWTTCAARLPVYVLLAEACFPEHAGTAIFAMYLLSIGLVIAGGLVLRHTALRREVREPLLVVLPPYQRPSLATIGASVWDRVRGFAIGAGKVIVVTLTVLWALMAVPVSGHEATPEHSLYGAGARAIAPVFAPAGFDDWHVSAALASGFVAKEVVIGAFAQSYVVDGSTKGLPQAVHDALDESSGGAPAAAGLALMVFVLGYTPCVTTVAEQWRRFGPRWTLIGVVGQMLVAWSLAVAVFQGASWLERLL